VSGCGQNGPRNDRQKLLDKIELSLELTSEKALWGREPVSGLFKNAALFVSGMR
jgi:hypothetical protein